ncbi:DUF4857 domain-containing protein [Prolixibacter sp. NT017]|uniref:DUF4857 domain-containing protein n=1 Tax=Prolixibacter sp. NT017 TaxID=2652390 RepID=UPI001299385D|nr:DUF4857 domain-containing protein [Prolixibacter sp. NT017]
MIKASRYILILLTVFTLSVFLPGFFRTAFERHVPVPFVMYSSVSHHFVMRKAADGKTMYYDSEGKQFNRSQYEQQLPLFHFRQLMTDGLMPDSLFGKPVDVFEINNANFFSRITPSDIDAPKPGLYPLFESESGRVALEKPDDYFRINDKGIQFIDPASNGVKPGKSALFTKVLTEKGMTFPAKMIAGIPTIRKKYDQGYFIVDKKEHLFHLKMEKGLPYCVQIRLPENFHILHIDCTDFSNQEFYGYIITKDSQVFVLETDTYKMINWPVKNYNPKTDKLSLRGNLDSRLAIVDKPNDVYAYASNRKYILQNEYHEKLIPNLSRGAQIVNQILFPIKIESGPGTSGFHRIVLKLPEKSLFIISNLFFLLLYLGIFFARKRKRIAIVELVIILLTGLYGFLGVLLLPTAKK